jgi:hypothetical protein
VKLCHRYTVPGMPSVKLPAAVACLAVGFVAVSAIPAVLRGGSSAGDRLGSVSRSFVASDLNGVTFKVMTQYLQGTSTGMAPECPQNIMITRGKPFVSIDGVLSIPYDRMKMWGTRDDAAKEPAETCTASSHGSLELAESKKLLGGEELDDLRESFDITKVFDDVTPEDVAAGAVVDEVKRLHQSVWVALKNKQYYTGKMDYSFKNDRQPQETPKGILCGERAMFARGELFLFIDEAKDVEIVVKTGARTTERITLGGNQRYAVVTTADSSCVYQVEDDKHSGRSSEDTKINVPQVCPSSCTCKC